MMPVQYYLQTHMLVLLFFPCHAHGTTNILTHLPFSNSCTGMNKELANHRILIFPLGNPLLHSCSLTVPKNTIVFDRLSCTKLISALTNFPDIHLWILTGTFLINSSGHLATDGKMTSMWNKHPQRHCEKGEVLGSDSSLLVIVNELAGSIILGIKDQSL